MASVSFGEIFCLLSATNGIPSQPLLGYGLMFAWSPTVDDANPARRYHYSEGFGI